MQVADLKVTHQRNNVVAGADFYPFGLAMENREITREDYRYGYQGQYAEKDKETGWNAFELRMYDGRIGRWLSPDPYGQFSSPYVAMGNNPITGMDPDGGLNIDPIITNASDMKWAEMYAANASRAFSINASQSLFTQSALYGMAHEINVGNPMGDLSFKSSYLDISKSQQRLDNYSQTEISNVWQSPQFNFDAESVMLPPTSLGPGDGFVADAVREGREPIGNAITNIMLTVVAPELAIGKVGVAFSVFKFGKLAKVGTNVVYQGIDGAGVVRYIGITKRAPTIRFAEHYNSLGTGKELLDYRIIEGATGLMRTQARIWEQTLINIHGLGKNGGALLNEINSIAPKNWIKYGIKK